jgi:hypothetical protein
MTQEAVERPRVKTWVRVSAAVLTLLGIPSIVWEFYMFRGGWGTAYALIQLVVLLWLIPLFAFVAVKARTPRYWSGLGTWPSPATPSRRSVRAVAWVSFAAIVGVGWTGLYLGTYWCWDGHNSGGRWIGSCSSQFGLTEFTVPLAVGALVAVVIWRGRK